jgi:hypothetical protein
VPYHLYNQFRPTSNVPNFPDPLVSHHPLPPGTKLGGSSPTPSTCANLGLRRFPQKQLDFRLGSITTNLKPYAHIEHTDQRSLSVPFLAYNNPDHRRLQKQLHTRSRRLEDQLRWNLASVSGQGSAEGVDPFDVSVLLAMAQMQERMLPPQSIYKVTCLLPSSLALIMTRDRLIFSSQTMQVRM